jgi:hypothetical protein
MFIQSATGRSIAKPIAKPAIIRTSVAVTPTEAAPIGQVSTAAKTTEDPPRVSATPTSRVGATFIPGAPLPTPQPASLATAKRVRVPTKRLADTTNQALANKVARVAAKEKRVRRAEARVQQEVMDATVKQEGDDEGTRLFKGE